MSASRQNREKQHTAHARIPRKSLAFLFLLPRFPALSPPPRLPSFCFPPGESARASESALTVACHAHIPAVPTRRRRCVAESDTACKVCGVWAHKREGQAAAAHGTSPPLPSLPSLSSPGPVDPSLPNSLTKPYQIPPSLPNSLAKLYQTPGDSTKPSGPVARNPTPKIGWERTRENSQRTRHLPALIGGEFSPAVRTRTPSSLPTQFRFGRIGRGACAMHVHSYGRHRCISHVW